MIAVQATRYTLKRSALGWALQASVTDGRSQTVDHLRTRSAAEHAVRELIAGRAHIEHHRPIGCRVQVIAER